MQHQGNLQHENIKIQHIPNLIRFDPIILPEIVTKMILNGTANGAVFKGPITSRDSSKCFNGRETTI